MSSFFHSALGSCLIKMDQRVLHFLQKFLSQYCTRNKTTCL